MQTSSSWSKKLNQSKGEYFCEEVLQIEEQVLWSSLEILIEGNLKLIAITITITLLIQGIIKITDNKINLYNVFLRKLH